MVIRFAGFLGEMEDVESGRTLVQKTHGVMFDSMYPHDLIERHASVHPTLPAILLLRNPAMYADNEIYIASCDLIMIFLGGK